MQNIVYSSMYIFQYRLTKGCERCHSYHKPSQAWVSSDARSFRPGSTALISTRIASTCPGRTVYQSGTRRNHVPEKTASQLISQTTTRHPLWKSDIHPRKCWCPPVTNSRMDAHSTGSRIRLYGTSPLACLEASVRPWGPCTNYPDRCCIDVLFKKIVLSVQ